MTATTTTTTMATSTTTSTSNKDKKELTELHGSVQRRGALHVLGIDVHLALDEVLHHVVVAPERRLVQGRTVRERLTRVGVGCGTHLSGSGTYCTPP